MNKKNQKTLEVVIPIYNEQEMMEELFSQLISFKKRLEEKVRVDFILVNDGSIDASLDQLIAYADQYPFVKVINLSRNYGHQVAITTGINHSSADYVAIIDADLQDPIHLIEAMYDKALEGYDCVYGKRIERKGESVFKKVSAKAFYYVMKKMCKVSIPRDTGDFRLISRRVVEALRQMPEIHRVTRALIPWTGYRSYALSYSREPRFAGSTKYSLRKMLSLSMDAMISFSVWPLRVATITGLLITFLGSIGALYMLYMKLFYPEFVRPGLTATLLAIVIIGGFQMMMLGLCGEYIGRIFEEVKRRPLCFIDGLWNFDKTEEPSVESLIKKSQVKYQKPISPGKLHKEII